MSNLSLRKLLKRRNNGMIFMLTIAATIAYIIWAGGIFMDSAKQTLDHAEDSVTQRTQAYFDKAQAAIDGHLQYVNQEWLPKDTPYLRHNLLKTEIATSDNLPPGEDTITATFNEYYWTFEFKTGSLSRAGCHVLEKGRITYASDIKVLTCEKGLLVLTKTAS